MYLVVCDAVLVIIIIIINIFQFSLALTLLLCTTTQKLEFSTTVGTMHTVKEMALHAPAISIIIQKVKYPLCFDVSPVTQHDESRAVQKRPLQSTNTTSKEGNGNAPVISIIV